MNKQKLIDTIRAVPISGRTYEEYVEAVADNMMAFCVEQASFDQMTEYILDHYAKQKAREIFEEIEKARKKWDTVHNIDHYGYNGSAFGYLEADVDHTIYELKKKYTEEGKG